MDKSKVFLLTVIMIYVFSGHSLAKSQELLPIPDKLVILTFDDSNVSDYTFTAPLLKNYGFGATFYIPTNCDWLGIPDRDDWRMTWEQIKSFDADGFEIGNHSYSGTGHQRSRPALCISKRHCQTHHLPHYGNVRSPATASCY